jgi:hypothetical protein
MHWHIFIVVFINICSHRSFFVRDVDVILIWRRWRPHGRLVVEDPSRVQGLPAFMDDGAGFIGVIGYGFQPASENPILETGEKVHSETSETLSTSNLLFLNDTFPDRFT